MTTCRDGTEKKKQNVQGEKAMKKENCVYRMCCGDREQERRRAKEREDEQNEETWWVMWEQVWERVKEKNKTWKIQDDSADRVTM